MKKLEEEKEIITFKLDEYPDFSKKYIRITDFHKSTFNSYLDSRIKKIAIWFVGIFGIFLSNTTEEKCKVIVYLLGNKMNSKEDRVVTQEEAKDLATRLNLEYVGISTETIDDINPCLKNLTKSLFFNK